MAVAHLRLLMRTNKKMTLDKAIKLLDNLLCKFKEDCTMVYLEDDDEFSFVESVEIVRCGCIENPSPETILEYDGKLNGNGMRIKVGISDTNVSYNLGLGWVRDRLTDRDLLGDDPVNESMFICAICKDLAKLMFDWFVLCTEVISDKPGDDVGVTMPISLLTGFWARHTISTVIGADPKSDKEYEYCLEYGVYIDKTIKDRMFPVALYIDNVSMMERDAA